MLPGSESTTFLLPGQIYADQRIWIQGAKTARKNLFKTDPGSDKNEIKNPKHWVIHFKSGGEGGGMVGRSKKSDLI